MIQSDKRYKSDEALNDLWFTKIIPAPSPVIASKQKSLFSRIFGLKRGGRLSRRKNVKRRQSKSLTRRRSQRSTH
jgi:hypothetical protein